MTIAAGLRFNSGLLLCADSQFTYGGVAKSPGKKVFAWRLPQSRTSVAFALAGDVDYAKNGISEILRAVSEQGAQTLADVLNAARSAHSQAYKHVFNHPRYQTDPRDYSLIMGIWTDSDGVELYSSFEDVITPAPEDTFVCRGSGDELFRYLLATMYRSDLSLEKAIILTAHALDEIKEHDPNVGFNSEFLVLNGKTGEGSGIAGYDIGHVEKFGRLLRRSMYDLLFLMSDLRESEEAVQRAKQLFQDNLSNLRSRYLQDKQYRNAMEVLIQILSQPGEHKLRLEFKLPSKISHADQAVKKSEP